jgi:hypothetical protein
MHISKHFIPSLKILVGDGRKRMFHAKVGMEHCWLLWLLWLLKKGVDCICWMMPATPVGSFLFLALAAVLPRLVGWWWGNHIE